MAMRNENGKITLTAMPVVTNPATTQNGLVVPTNTATVTPAAIRAMDPNVAATHHRVFELSIVWVS